MQKTREKNEKPELLKASIIFALVVIAAFAPVVFLDQTYYRNTPIPPEFLILLTVRLSLSEMKFL